MTDHRYFIIGNSAAAVGAIAGIRNTDREGGITLIAREPHHTYSRPLISYLLAGTVDESRMPFRPPDFYEASNVRAVLGTEATTLDVDARTVGTADGRNFTFEKLLIATGAAPIVPSNFAGLQAQGLFTFTTWDDARSIKRFIETTADAPERLRAVVVGGGLIGLKAVEALHALGLDVTMVELADRILSASFDQTASDLARSALQNAGVDVRCATTVANVHTRDGRIDSVELTDGTSKPCELLILAVGVAPQIALVKNTAVRTDRGILVDEFMQTSVQNVYAAGDVAQATELLSGQKRPIAIFPVACRQGFTAGCNMTGERRPYHGGLAKNAVDICGLPTISVGLTCPEGDGFEVLSSLDEAGPVYRKLVLKDNRIVGMIFVGCIDRAGIITGLIRQRVDVSSFKDLLLTDRFGLISLPVEYRKHMVSGAGIEV